MDQKACYIWLTQPRDGRNRAMVRCGIDRPAKEIDQGSRPPLLDCSKEGVRQYFMRWANFLGRYASSMLGIRGDRELLRNGKYEDTERFHYIRFVSNILTNLLMSRPFPRFPLVHANLN